MATLSELREALNALGVATDTGGLRGEQRRAELLKRLQTVQGAATTLSTSSTDKRSADSNPRSLAELRQALEARGLPTVTPGLQGDARRHALAQRLLHAQSSSRIDEPDEDDAKSEASTSSGSTAYSTAREFLFFDLPTARETDARPSVPTLQLSAAPVELEAAQDALFERRQQLHAMRQERQRQVQAVLDRAGIAERLEVLSARLEALATEKQRLANSFAGHQLVTSRVLGSLSARDSGTSDADPRELELVQQDALELIQRHQRSTRQLIDRTKQAVAIVKTARRGQDEDGQATPSSGRSSTACSSTESELEREIRELEAHIQRQSSRSSIVSQQQTSLAKENGPVLLRCRSVPHSMFLHEWKQLTPEQRQQLHAELRHAASFRIQRGRVCLHPTTARPAGDSSSHRPPSRADRLGIKARFHEASGRPALETHRAYQAALAEDPDHVPSLLHYARFLAFRLGNKSFSDQVERFLRRAVMIEPTNAQALATYATFLSRVRVDGASAVSYFDLALQQLGRGGPARPGILGDYADALLSAESSIGNEPQTQLLQKARQLLTEALDIAPGHTENQRRLVRVLCELSDVDNPSRLSPQRRLKSVRNLKK